MLIALIFSTLTDGCGTTERPLPLNTVTVENRTPYNLFISRDGAPWMETTNEMRQKTVTPKSIAILRDFGTNGRIILDFRAVYYEQLGCLRFDEKMGATRRTVIVGSNSPRQDIIIRRWNFH